MQYLYISGTSVSGRFLVNLPKTIILDEKSEIALVDIKFEKPTPSVYLLCNICCESLYNDSILPIIRRIDGRINIYTYPLFHEIVIKELNTFYLYFKNADWSDVNTSFAMTLCLRSKSTNTL